MTNNINVTNNEQPSKARFVVLGIILAIVTVVIIVCAIKIFSVGKSADDIDIMSALDVAFEDEFRLYGKKIKQVQTYYPMQSGGEPYTVTVDYNQDGKITSMEIKSDDSKLDEVIEVQYETIKNTRKVIWINQGNVIKEMDYIGLTKTNEKYYDENGNLMKEYEYQFDSSYEGKTADYIYDRTEKIDYAYVHEKYEEASLNKEKKLYSIYFRNSPTSRWEYVGEKICDTYGHILKQDFWNNMYVEERYTYEYIFDKDGSEMEYEKYCGNELISSTKIEYFN